MIKIGNDYFLPVTSCRDEVENDVPDDNFPEAYINVKHIIGFCLEYHRGYVTIMTDDLECYEGRSIRWYTTETIFKSNMKEVDLV